VQRGIWVPTQHLLWEQENPWKNLIELKKVSFVEFYIRWNTTKLLFYKRCDLVMLGDLFWPLHENFECSFQDTVIWDEAGGTHQVEFRKGSSDAERSCNDRRMGFWLFMSLLFFPSQSALSSCHTVYFYCRKLFISTHTYHYIFLAQNLTLSSLCLGLLFTIFVAGNE
jgi:hypothetical protein